MLNDNVLKKFILGFYGYGNFDADFWFVGAEEHIGTPSSHTKLERKFGKKLNAWDAKGSRPLEDLVDFNWELGGAKHFDERAVLVKTWNRIIHVLLGIDGGSHRRPQVKNYQRNQLARGTECNSCLMELLPLPAPNVNAWLPWCGVSSIAYLKSRSDFVEVVRPKRIARLKREIEIHQPKAVVFYGKSNWKHYRDIAGVEFQSSEMDGVKIGNNERTLVVLMRHVADWRVKNKDCYEIGRMIQSRIAELGL